MAPRQTPRKGKQPEASPTSIFDMLTLLDSPASSVATTPGALPSSPLPTTCNGSHGGTQTGSQPAGSQTASTRRSPRNAVARKRGDALPPPCRSRGAAAQPQLAAPTACVKHPWWHFRSAAPDAAPAAAANMLVSQPSGELPPLPRPPSFSRQDSGSGRGQAFRSFAGAASHPAVASSRGADPAASDLPEGRPMTHGGRRLSYSSDASVSESAPNAAGKLGSEKEPAMLHTDFSMQLPALHIDRADSNTSSSSFSLWRSGSGITTTDTQQGGSAQSTDGSSLELVRQRSGRGSFDFGRPGPLARTSSLNEAKVLMATDLKRTDSMLSPQLFHFDDHFEFEEIIGRSTMSEVFRVRHKISGEPFAVKRSRRKFASRAHRRRCLHEIQAVAGLPRHPNVVGQYRAWQQGGHFYIQMDLCAGGSLSDLLRQTEADGKAGVGEAAVWQVAAEVAAGLAFLHAAGVLHLDVKPGNVFADGAGNLKLGDFGLAVLRHQWEWEEGDGNYVAPELLAANTEASPAADMFSLGATLYECSTGESLPRSGPPEAALDRLGVSVQLRRLIAALLQSNPATRPTAQAVAEQAAKALAAIGAEIACGNGGGAAGGAAASTPGALPPSLGEHLPLQSPIAGLLVQRRLALTPLTDDSMADSTPKSDRLTPFSMASTATPPTPARSRHPPPDMASPATPCLRLALLGSGGATGLSDGAAQRVNGTPAMVPLRADGRGAEPASPAVSGVSPSSMAPLKAPPTLSGWRMEPQMQAGVPASAASVSPVERWPRRRFSFGAGPSSPSSPAAWPEATLAAASGPDGKAEAATPWLARAFGQTDGSDSPVGGAASAWQQNSSTRRHDAACASTAQLQIDSATTPFDCTDAQRQPGGSPDTASPMQPDEEQDAGPPNPFERAVGMATPGSSRRPGSVGVKRRLMRTSGEVRRPSNMALHEWAANASEDQGAVQAADGAVSSFGSMTL